MTEKIAPVQGYSAGIPWSLHLRAYDAYCEKWGAQPALIDFEGRRCRGGFSTGELDDFIPGWREEASEISRLKAENERLAMRVAELEEAVKAARADALEEAARMARCAARRSFDPSDIRGAAVERFAAQIERDILVIRALPGSPS